jgi:hypothetical protein
MIPDLPGWDSLPTVARYHNWAEMAGIVALAFLIIAEIITYKYGHRKDELSEQQQLVTNQRHDEEMARLHLEGDQTRERAAQLEKEAAEAKLALEKIKQPRTLSPDAIANIGKILVPFANTKFDVSVIPGDPEALTFVRYIVASLEAAQWTWVEYNHPAGPLMNVYRIGDKPNIGQQGSVGVDIALFPDQAGFEAATDALVSALRVEGVVANRAIANEGIPNHDTLHIMVGKKPL